MSEDPTKPPDEKPPPRKRVTDALKKISRDVRERKEQEAAAAAQAEAEEQDEPRPAE